MTLPIHPFAELFPPLEGAALDALVADIKVNGLLNPVILFEDMVLDGRNRLRACEIAGVVPRYEVYEGDNPLGFVVSLNIKRRHLEAGQRAASGANMATLKHGGDRGGNQFGKWQVATLQLDITREEAAKMVDVSKRSVGCGGSDQVREPRGV